MVKNLSLVVAKMRKRSLWSSGDSPIPHVVDYTAYLFHPPSVVKVEVMEVKFEFRDGDFSKISAYTSHSVSATRGRMDTNLCIWKTHVFARFDREHLIWL